METINPKNYMITLHLDAEKDTFKGKTVISLSSTEETAEIILNSDDLEIKSYHLVKVDKKIPCNYEVSQDHHYLE
jgi:aminopeptidase N